MVHVPVRARAGAGCAGVSLPAYRGRGRVPGVVPSQMRVEADCAEASLRLGSRWSRTRAPRVVVPVPARLRVEAGCTGASWRSDSLSLCIQNLPMCRGRGRAPGVLPARTRVGADCAGGVRLRGELWPYIWTLSAAFGFVPAQLLPAQLPAHLREGVGCAGVGRRPSSQEEPSCFPTRSPGSWSCP